jgi:hypothetical protein
MNFVGWRFIFVHAGFHEVEIPRWAAVELSCHTGNSAVSKRQRTSFRYGEWQRLWIEEPVMFNPFAEVV